MPRGKSTDDLKREWGSISRDWYSAYQWPSLGMSAYSEQVAALILDDYQQMRLNVEGLRQSNYALTSHRGQCGLQTAISQFTEKRFVRAMYNLHDAGSLGKMLDYEVPLKAYRSAPHGDIDLLSLNEASLFIIEVKQHHSRESILKGLLQAYTYARLVQEVKVRFTRSFGLERSVVLVPAVLTFDTAASGRQLRSFAEYPNSKALLCCLNVDMVGLGLGQIRAYVSTDKEATLDECLTANPSDLGGCMVSFREGFIPQFRRILP